MTETVRISMIVARARNGVIGVDGDLPWRLSDDLKFFKETTKGHPIIMGRKTWESLPRKPLPGRDNLVLTRNRDFLAPGARVYSDLNAALESASSLAFAKGVREVFIIGGASLYAEGLTLANTLYITEVDVEIEGDAFFPEFDETLYEEIASQKTEANESNDHTFTIRTLRRRLSPRRS